MYGRALCGLFALAVCATAASVSGIAGIDPTKVYAGGQITFPQIPGINAPLFSWFSNSASKDESNNAINSATYVNGKPVSSSSNGDSSFGPFGPFLQLIPGLNLLLPGNGNANPLSSFANLESALAQLSNGNRTANFTLPAFQLPGLNEGPYIPGLSEALGSARQHLKTALNITADLSTGLRDAIQTALESNDPAGGVRIILNTIASVYSTVAADCPLLLIGARVFQEGIRLAGEVARSVVNVIAGPGNDIRVTF